VSIAELDEQLLRDHPLPPVGQGDKDARGSILIIAGSRDVAGAALLTAMGAMRSGAGRLQIATARSAAPQLAFAMPEAMVKNGNRLALDAALLRVLPQREADAKRAEIPPILLPHAGEMASLLECEEDEVEADPLGAGRRCADRYDAVTLVKGVESHIVAPDGQAFHYGGGGPGLGVSGSGDMLAGIVGGLLARGADPLTALLWGVWCHGEAGRRLGKRIGTLGYLARELADEVPALLFPGQAPA
jgi:NAD(P)H-hydrate repair Nnr-like enzyme with NAD(P)H-hydrate dehydratase domain